MRNNNFLKIGIIGSYKDKYFKPALTRIAFSAGKFIAQNKCILIVGPEPSVKLDSGVIAAAAKGAKSANGLVVGILPRFYTGYQPKNIDITIYTAGEMGGSRELILASSCDALISIAGGAGTLCEIALAYHNRIPLVALKNSGGISQQFAGKYLDYRKELHRPIAGADNPKQAVEKAIRLAKNFRKLRQK